MKISHQKWKQSHWASLLICAGLYFELEKVTTAEFGNTCTSLKISNNIKQRYICVPPYLISMAETNKVHFTIVGHDFLHPTYVLDLVL